LAAMVVAFLVFLLVVVEWKGTLVIVGGTAILFFWVSVACWLIESGSTVP
jgi:hypothetical protein